LLTGDPGAVLGTMYADRDPWYREVADAIVEVRPAHEEGDKPKWNLAEQVQAAFERARADQAGRLRGVEIELGG
jgi:hypothetical protein